MKTELARLQISWLLGDVVRGDHHATRMIALRTVAARMAAHNRGLLTDVLSLLGHPGTKLMRQLNAFEVQVQDFLEENAYRGQ